LCLGALGCLLVASGSVFYDGSTNTFHPYVGDGVVTSGAGLCARLYRWPDRLLHVVADAHDSLAYRAAAAAAFCFGAASLLVHVLVVLGFTEAPWTSDVLFPVAFAFLVVSGLIAAWRGRDQPILKRYDPSIQGWRARPVQIAKLSAFYSVVCFVALVVVRLRTHGVMPARFSQAIEASHSAAFFLIAAMIFSAVPPAIHK
jgi:hypothetical protein